MSNPSPLISSVYSPKPLLGSGLSRFVSCGAGGFFLVLWRISRDHFDIAAGFFNRCNRAFSGACYDEFHLSGDLAFAQQPDLGVARWTAVTNDGSLSAQFEQTIVVTDNGWESLTPYEL